MLLLDPRGFTLPPNSDQLIDIQTGDQRSIDGYGVHERIAELELELDALADAIEGCRKTIMLAKLAVTAGGTLLAIGFLRLDPVGLVVGLAAVLGGLALWGSTGTTRDEIMSSIGAHETQRAELIDGLIRDVQQASD